MKDTKADPIVTSNELEGSLQSVSAVTSGIIDNTRWVKRVLFCISTLAEETLKRATLAQNCVGIEFVLQYENVSCFICSTVFKKHLDAVLRDMI